MDATVLIPTTVRKEVLLPCLDALAKVSMDGIRAEILLLPNASERSPESLLVNKRFPVPIRVIRTNGLGKNSALNEGFAAAVGKYLVFLDDDIVVPSSYFVELAKGLHRWPEADCFGGPVALRWPENQIRTPDERVICYVKGFAYASLDPLPSGEGVVDPEIFLGNNMAIRRCALSGKRPFDEGTGPSPGLYRMGGMAPVFQYLREQNHQSIYLPAMSVEHLVRKEQMSFEWILRRSRSWGRSLAFFGNQFRDINGAASVPSILLMLAFRAFRCARLSLKQTKYPGYWARIDIEILLGILSEKLRIEK